MHGSRSQCNLEGGASHTYLGNGTYTTTGRSGGSAGAERERERERKERGMGGLEMKDHTSYSINMGSGDDAPMSFINPMYLETPGVISRAGQRVRTGSKLARTTGIIDDSDEQMHFTNPMYEEEGFTGGSGGRGRGTGGGMRTGSKKVRSSGNGIIDDTDEQMHFTNPMYEEEGFTGGSGGRGRGTGGGMRTGTKKVRSSGNGIIDDSDEQMHFTNPMYEEEGFTGGSGGRGRGMGTSVRKGRRSVGGDESSTGTGAGTGYDSMGRARGASVDHVDYFNPMYLTNGQGSLLGLGRGDTAALGLGAGAGLNQSFSKSPPSSTKKSKYVSLNDTSPLAYQRR
jgi:hypothetical protein